MHRRVNRREYMGGYDTTAVYVPPSSNGRRVYPGTSQVKPLAMIIQTQTDQTNLLKSLATIGNTGCLKEKYTFRNNVSNGFFV